MDAASKGEQLHHHYKVIHESIFDFIRPEVNLARITEQQFKDEVKFAEESGIKVDENATYAALRMSYKRLQVLQTNFINNIPYQTTLLTLRNAAFASGIFLAKSGATEFVKNAGDMLEAIGLEDKKIAIDAISLAIRVFFAISTAPIDNALTKLSSGEMSFDEFRQMKFSEQFSFRGATARTAFVLCAFFTIVYGATTGESIKEKMEESPLFAATLKILTQGCEEHRKLRTGAGIGENIGKNTELTDSASGQTEDTNKVLDNIIKFADPQTKDQLMEEKSIELLKFLLEDCSSDESMSRLQDARKFLDAVVDYMEKNPGLLAGINTKDSDIILENNLGTSSKKVPSTHPSQTTTATRDVSIHK